MSSSFKKCDRQGCGRVSEEDFLSAVDKDEHLLPQDCERLVGWYRCADGTVDYVEFCETLENVFRIPHLDMKPTVARNPIGHVPVFRQPSHAADALTPLSEDEEDG